MRTFKLTDWVDCKWVTTLAPMRWSWKELFLTFETIMQGFELAYNQRSSIVDDIRKQAEVKTDEINNLNLKSDLTDLDKRIEVIRNDIFLIC